MKQNWFRIFDKTGQIKIFKIRNRSNQKMNSLGEKIRKLREEKKLPLRTVAAYLDIDQAILSKIERGRRSSSREYVVKLARYFKIEESDLLISWLSDKLVHEVGDEEVALKALQVAEETIEYQAFLKIDRKKNLDQLKKGIREFPTIKQAWMYGSRSAQRYRYCH